VPVHHAQCNRICLGEKLMANQSLDTLIAYLQSLPINSMEYSYKCIITFILNKLKEIQSEL